MMYRQPAVAGSFYPADPKQLHALIEQYLHDARTDCKVPKAMIVPHAGYIYSGPVAAKAYARVAQARKQIRKVVLIGPSHRLSFTGLAVCDAEHFSTPLGDIPIDLKAIDALVDLPFVDYLETAHAQEHSLEVHLPFLQEVLDDFTLVPIVAGNAQPEQIKMLLTQLWGGPETLIIISSDLSHYYDYDTAQKRDRATSTSIEKLQFESLDSHCACGFIPVSGLLAFAKSNGLKITTIDLRNSGDTAGNKDRVVGYGAYVIE